MTKQEMFDKAYRGLASQGWAIAAGFGGCMYAKRDPDTREVIARCAWGWVDPEGTEGGSVYGSVETLRNLGIGIAAYLSREELSFAMELQDAHDRCNLSHAHRYFGKLKESMEDFAKEYGLTIPQL